MSWTGGEDVTRMTCEGCHGYKDGHLSSSQNDIWSGLLRSGPITEDLVLRWLNHARNNNVNQVKISFLICIYKSCQFGVFGLDSGLLMLGLMLNYQ